MPKKTSNQYRVGQNALGLLHQRLERFLLVQMSNTPKKMVIDYLFANNLKHGEIFWEKVKSVEKDYVTKRDISEASQEIVHRL